MLPPRLLSGTAVSAAGRLLGTGLSLLTIGLVSRSLVTEGGVSAYGSYATIFVLLSFVAILADGGLSLVFTRIGAGVDSATEGALFRRLLTIRLVTLVLACGVVASVAVFVPRYPDVVRLGVIIGTFGIASQLITQLTLGVFQKRLRMATPAAAEIAGRAATLLLVLLAASRQGGALFFIGAFVGGTLVTLVIQLAATRRFIGIPSPEASSPTPLPDIRSLLSEAWPLSLLLLCSFVVFRADSLLLSLLRPPQDLGWYALPYKVLESLLFFPAMIGGLLFPVLSRSLNKARDREQFHATLTAATDLFLLLAIPTVALLILGAPWIIGLLGGPSFAPSVPVLRILAVALGALFFGNLYGNSAIALGERRSLLGAAAALAALNIGVNLLVIPRYSFLGAAWTTLGTELLSAVAAAWIVFRHTHRFAVSPRQLHTVSAGGVFLFIILLPLPNFGRLVLGLAAYGAALWAFGVLTPKSLRVLLRAQREGTVETSR